MRIVPSLLIALALVFCVSAATRSASADDHEAVKRGANEKVETSKEKTEAAKEEADKKGSEVKDDAKAKAEARKEAQQAKIEARKEAQRAKIEARKEAQQARIEAAKAARKDRLLKQEERRHAGQMKEIAGRRERIIQLRDKQLENVDVAKAREKARHEKRVEQIATQ